MTQIPPPPTGYQAPGAYVPPPASQTNVPAIISLICGIVGCLVVTPIVGIVTGIIGISKAKPPVGGKGMAIAGIILSVLWILGGIGLVGGTIWGVGKVKQMVAETTRQPTINFVNHLVDGDIDAASSMSGLPKDQLKSISDNVKPLGKCQDISIDFPQFQNINGVVTASFSGKAVFDNGTKDISATVVIDKDGAKVQAIKLN